MRTLSSELGRYASRLSGTNPRIYADANLPTGVIAFMRHRLTWDVLFVLEHDDLRRASDSQHYELARQLCRILVTLDRDYLDDRRFPDALSGGVIIINAPDERAMIRVLRRIDRACFKRKGPKISLAGRKIYAQPDWQPSTKPRGRA